MATQQYKTPGVYIQEPNSFPPSIVGVETAVPCFIGYTWKATDTDNRSLTMIPRRIESLAEFVTIFGRGYPEKYYLLAVTDGATAAGSASAASAPAANASTGQAGAATATGTGVPHDDQDWGILSLDGKNRYRLVEFGNASYNLYNSMRLFYANGGGHCYVISCGTFGDTETPTGISKTDLESAIKVCGTFVGPTMVAVPDAVLLKDENDFNSVVQTMLKMCGKAGDRMALIDVWGADKIDFQRDDWNAVLTQIKSFREHAVAGLEDCWKYGAAYFPPLVTSVVSADEVDVSNFVTDTAKLATLKLALQQALEASFPPEPGGQAAVRPAQGGGEVTAAAGAANPPAAAGATGTATTTTLTTLNDKGNQIYASHVATLTADLAKDPKLAKRATQALSAMVPGFSALLTAIARTQGVLPPSGAMAGVWVTNDNVRGVWNAPANTGIVTLIAPKIPIMGDQQDDLNVPVNSMAINAIRTFPGRGTLVWGARTLDSNSNDWRYIQVRRTMIYVEQSVKQALEAMVFRPNTAQTWVTVVAMIESFLHGLWAAGGLMGGSPTEAYNVQAGLGSTMTPQDVLEGIMRVQITLQMVHPAEFIELTFKQQMLGGA
jgi:phage tail sheath protein FI